MGCKPTFRWSSPLSRQMDSMALREVSRMVPPGVSYTPRDFMPTKRLSTMSILPMPLSPATFAERQPHDHFQPVSCQVLMRGPLDQSTQEHRGKTAQTELHAWSGIRRHIQVFRMETCFA